MSDVWTWFVAGGPTMAALGGVGAAMFFLILERLLATGGRIRLLRRGGDGPLPRGRAELSGLRRMGLIRSCIVIAPLLGLLGTVGGMIETFQAILGGGYVREMSEGIRKALLTTEYGLAIAAPGLLAECILLRRQEKLNRLERERRSLCGGVS